LFTARPARVIMQRQTRPCAAAVLGSATASIGGRAHI
jgi:hypothetical protein